MEILQLWMWIAAVKDVMKYGMRTGNITPKSPHRSS
jgi:hypothetical protein